MDKLIGEQLCLGTLTLAKLGTYHRSFFSITQYLIDKNRLSTSEQSRAFLRGFHSGLRTHIIHRLEIKLPDHFPDDPYTMQEILEAAKFVLHDMSPTLFQSHIEHTTVYYHDFSHHFDILCTATTMLHKLQK
jgi:hypothetical protein